MENNVFDGISRACERLSIAYAVYLDTQRYGEFAALFGDEGVLKVSGRVEGQTAIARAMANRPATLRSRHVLTNILIEPVDQEHATGTTYLSLYRHIGEASLEARPIEPFAPAVVGHYSDQFKLTNQGWRFAYRELHLAFRNPEYFDPFGG